MRQIGIDIGGTFTDTVLVDEGEIHAVKTSSTADFLTGLSQGIEKGCKEAEISPKDIDTFSHGSTIAVNALIEETGAETAIVTTAGFADVFEIEEGYRSAELLYAPCNDTEAPLIPRQHRYGVTERINAQGEIITELDFEDVDRVIDELTEAGVEAVAICLLHAYRDSKHEQQIVKRFAERAPEIDVSRSSQVSPQIREYARTATTVVDAYLKPEFSQYLQRLESELGEVGIQSPVSIMKSDGGLARPTIAAERPVTQVISGPVAGVNAASFIADQRGLKDILTFDMGGTSCDVAVVADGEPLEVPHRELRGLKINGPFINIETVGAGGGSIAYLDEIGALKVGPESAGADPGPACYGRGGTRPTVTDADLVLGVLNSDNFASGTMTLDVDAARESIRNHVADPMGTDVENAAVAIRDVINTKMASATRVVVINEGIDPRELSLVSFGGAGPAHACNVATELGIDKVVFPSRPGVFSSLGLLVSDLRHEYVRSFIETVNDIDPGQVTAGIEELIEQGHDDLEAEDVAVEDRSFQITFDMMYEGQAHYLNVVFPDRTVSRSSLMDLIETFEAAHERQYGFVDERNPIELVNLRVTAVGSTPDPPIEPAGDVGSPDPSVAKEGTREVILDPEERVDTPYFDRRRLRPGHELSGPAIVEFDNTTIWLSPLFEGRIDRYGNLVATRI